MSDSLLKPLNQSIKQSVEPVPQPRSLPADRSSLNQVYTQSISAEPQIETKPQSTKKYKIISGVGICLFIFGLLMFLLFPPLIQSQIVQQGIEKSILSPDNQGIWAHIPGESQTIITRNYSFFNFINEERFFLYGEKPIVREAEGYIIQELEDYVDIKYNDDMTKVKMKDWLHFSIHNDSRSFEQRCKILNAASLGFWYTLKNSRDQLIFIEGFALLYTSIMDSIVETVLGQGVSSQYLVDYKTAYLELFQPAGISVDNSLFLWNDTAYGFSNKDNLKFWVEAAMNSFSANQPVFSSDALDLKDYFTLSDSELFSLLSQINEFTDSIQSLIFDNYYCKDLQKCTGEELAVRQLSEAYVTFKTPPVSSITPTDTICTDNITCNGYYPEIYAYYKNVYLVEHPDADPFIKFDVDMVRNWVNFNPTGKEGEYSKAENMLLHIGNLDALFNNGTMHDKAKKDYLESTPYLKNIMKRFGLPAEEDTRVFWQWIKYLVKHVLRQGTPGNEVLGIANAFSGSMYDSFSYLQNNLQNRLLLALISNQLASQNCDTFIGTSLQTSNEDTISKICNNYNHNIQTTKFVQDSINTCRNKYGKEWKNLQLLGATKLQTESFCDKTVKDGFGDVYHRMRVLLNDFYSCDHTPNQYCSDYELALKQWSNSSVTLEQPPQVGNAFKKSTTFADWDSKAFPIQYYHYQQKFPDKVFPVKTMDQAYKLFNFDSIFSAPIGIKVFSDKKQSELWKDYMRYIVVFVGFKGLTVQRTVRDYVFGYNDEYLLSRKNKYPPFGGDPSVPAYIAFNDLNTTLDEVTLEIEMHTGKADSVLTGQYYKINGLTYLTTNYTRFNGNQTYWVLESPWDGNDYFYGTNGKNFAPDQPNSKNVSIYVPNLQRYGSGSLNQSYPYERYGYDLSIAYLGRYIYESANQFPENKKYYQNYFGVFNETSVLGFPFFMTKHHFMNVSSNWSSYVRTFNENGTIQFLETSHWDDSYVIVEPYSGVSFQSTLFLQANFFYEPDQLFKYNQTLMLPVFAIYRSGNLTQAEADKLFGPLVTALNVKTIIFYVGIVLTLIGLGLIVFGVLNFRRVKRINQEGESKVKASIKISMQQQKRFKSSSLKQAPESQISGKLIREQEEL